MNDDEQREKDLNLLLVSIWPMSQEEISELKKRLAAYMGTEHEARARTVNTNANQVQTLRAHERYSF